MATAQFLVDSARLGLDNMAIDQSMLHQTALDGITRIRFYRWSQPTLSLGYFQRFAEFEQFQKAAIDQSGPSRACEPLTVVRRATGGGAIVHHFDWTYSVAIPQEIDAKQKSIGASCGLYFNVHRAVIDWLNQTSLCSTIKARLWGSGDNSNESEGGCSSLNNNLTRNQPLPFLCFQRRSSGDVVVGNVKLMGSAQRRFQSAILQHGSLLLQKSNFAPHLAGLIELQGQTDWEEEKISVSLQKLAEMILQKMGNCYQLDVFQRETIESFVEVDRDFRKRLESCQWTARI